MFFFHIERFSCCIDVFNKFVRVCISFEEYFYLEIIIENHCKVVQFCMLEYCYERICSVVNSSRKLVSISKAVHILMQINSKS